MSRVKKGAVRRGRGVMCNICGRNCGKGGALKKHVEGTHEVPYDRYKRCFYGDEQIIIADSWDDSILTSSGDTVVIQVLVRRFMGNPGPRGATRNARSG